jgi:hypothetical protein
MTKRLNWANRQGPGEFDKTAPEAVHYDFDHRRNVIPGSQSWPEKFGPSSIKKAWKAGLVVVAEIQDFPHPVAIGEARWTEFGKVLVVKTLEGWKVADRIWTRPDARNLTSSGLLIEDGK